MFRHGTLDVEAYAPRGTDLQQPHLRDEAYVAVRGRGEVVYGERRDRVEPGAFPFAPAGLPHRFESFTDDLAIGVLF